MKVGIASIVLLGMVVLGFGSCTNDTVEPAENTITIRILEPLAGEIVSDASSVHMHIEVEATDENHEVEIELHPIDNQEDHIIDYHLHDHDRLITFEQEVDLSGYPSGTKFQLEVYACIDHECLSTAESEITFSIP